MSLNKYCLMFKLAQYITFGPSTSVKLASGQSAVVAK